MFGARRSDAGREPLPAVRRQLRCACGGVVTRVHARGFVERLARIFGRRVWRCYECGERMLGPPSDV